MVKNFLLPVFGDENPFDIQLSIEDLKVKEQLFKNFGGRTTSSGGKPARMAIKLDRGTRNLKYVKDKFQGSPDVIKGLCGSSTNGHPVIFRWSNLKGGNVNLIELFDQAEHLSWHSPREFSSGFACDSVLSSFLNSLGYTFDLRQGDESSLAYLACTSPSWLPIPSMSGPKYAHDSAYQKIGAKTPVGKGKEKKIKKDTVKKSKVEESVESTEDLKEVDPSVIGKKVIHPTIPKLRVKTNVESSILQIPVGSFKGTSSVAVTSSAQVVQDPEATQSPIPKGPKYGQTSSPTKTVMAKQTVEIVMAKESLGVTTSSTRKARDLPDHLRPVGLSPPKEKDTIMEKALEMTVLDANSGLPAFLTHFDSLEFNSLPISHFPHFGPPFVNFLRFFVPGEDLPLLEELLRVLGDFTSGFRGGVFLGNILWSSSVLCWFP
ncbi:hypothetical protein SO802_007726 [Lithocarpus litseifolius]|uniref:Uncharacterized protein n=1 Tax=Lithocarpus litseifolius TaxID=425828 RepID=A0AAW2DPR2_9ROSI